MGSIPTLPTMRCSFNGQDRTLRTFRRGFNSLTALHFAKHDTCATVYTVSGVIGEPNVASFYGSIVQRIRAPVFETGYHGSNPCRASILNGEQEVAAKAEEVPAIWSRCRGSCGARKRTGKSSASLALSTCPKRLHTDARQIGQRLTTDKDCRVAA